MKQFIKPAVPHRKNLRELLVLTLLGVLLFVVQVALAVLPNVEFVTALIIVIATVFGAKSLISVYVFAGLEIMVYGLGVWNIMYIYVWAILAGIVMLTRRFATPLINAILAAFFGLFFGCLCSIPYFIVGGPAMGIPWIIQGIPYDLIHCIANFILVFFSFNPLVRVLEKSIKN